MLVCMSDIRSGHGDSLVSKPRRMPTGLCKRQSCALQRRRRLAAGDALPAQIFILPLKSSDSPRQLKPGVCISLRALPASLTAEIHSTSPSSAFLTAECAAGATSEGAVTSRQSLAKGLRRA